MRVDAAFLERLALGEDAAVRFLRPVVRKCVKSVVAKMPAAQPLLDDIEQDTWIFIIRHASRIDPQYNVEPYLIKVGRNMAMQNMDRYGDVDFRKTLDAEDESNPDDLGATGMAGLDGREIVEWIDRDPFVDVLSRRNALEFLRGRSKTLQDIEEGVFNVEPQEPPDMKPIISSNGHQTVAPHFFEADDSVTPDGSQAAESLERRKAKGLDPSKITHRQLRDIRIKLGLSQVEMSEKLGVKLPTYQSYEYGKTHTVNEDVLTRARQLALEDDYSFTREKFSGKNMAEIARNWAERLGVDPERVTEFASTMGVNKSTVSRWLTKNPVPNVWELIRYEDIVSRQERRLRATRPS